MATKYKEADAVRVKGGMPIDVSGCLVSDETGSAWEIDIYWHKTYKTVTKNFRDSLSENDWFTIVNALERA